MDASILRIPWDDALTSYDFGPGHPLAPIRVELTMELARTLGVFDAPGVVVEPFESADDRLLELVHSAEYIAAVKGAGAGGTSRVQLLEHGLGTPDNPVFPGMHEASARIVGASVAAADAVWSGASVHAANMAGGLHHAMRDSASGFCVYNDAAIAIARLLERGAERVAYVDIDVHHGDGVQAAFYDDPRVLTISVHETPATLFPGTGRPSETGGPGADGMSVNVALPPGTTDEPWLRALDAVAGPLVRAFAPEVLVTQHGCDTHALDPLAHLGLSVDGQFAAAEYLHRLAHECVEGGRWVVLGGGGYELVQVVPRIWTRVLAQAAHRPIEADVETPENWRRYVAERMGVGTTLGTEAGAGASAPESMSDGARPVLRPWVAGYDPANRVDQAILATRGAVFPSHGLDPMP